MTKMILQLEHAIPVCIFPELGMLVFVALCHKTFPRTPETQTHTSPKMVYMLFVFPNEACLRAVFGGSTKLVLLSSGVV